MSDMGFSTGVSNLALTFDDAGGTVPEPLVPGTFRPTNQDPPDAMPAPAPAGPYSGVLTVFNGLDANGTWSLFILDDANADTGSLAGGWSLTITTQGTGGAAPLVTWWNPGDGRLNPQEAAPVAIYCTTQGSVYGYAPGYLVFEALPDQIAAVEEHPAENTLIVEGIEGARLFRLATGAFQFNIPMRDGMEYVFAFDACPPTFTWTRVWNPATGETLVEHYERK